MGGVSQLEFSLHRPPEGPQPSPPTDDPALPHAPPLLLAFYFFPLTVHLLRTILVSGRGPELSTEVTEWTSYAPRGLTG